MNVLVEEQCLKDIANAIRKKGEVTTTYKPREMAVAIEKLQTGGSGCLVKIEQSANQKITATYRGKTYTDDFFVLIGDSFQTSITADKYYTAGTVNYNGVPLKGDITIKATQATEARKYRVIIEQSANQKITATWDGKTYTSTFYAYEGSRITFAVKADSGYLAGTLNYTAISSLSGDITVRATEAIKKPVEYFNMAFKISKKYNGYGDESSYVFCQFVGSDETFNIELFDRYNSSKRKITVTGNRELEKWLNSQYVYMHSTESYDTKTVATFKCSTSTREFNAGFFLNFSDGRELIFKPE